MVFQKWAAGLKTQTIWRQFLRSDWTRKGKEREANMNVKANPNVNSKKRWGGYFQKGERWDLTGKTRSKRINKQIITSQKELQSSLVVVIVGLLQEGSCYEWVAVVSSPKREAMKALKHWVAYRNNPYLVRVKMWTLVWAVKCEWTYEYERMKAWEHVSF